MKKRLQKMLDFRGETPWEVRSEVNGYLDAGWIVKKIKTKVDNKKQHITGLVLIEFKGEENEKKKDTG